MTNETEHENKNKKFNPTIGFFRFTNTILINNRRYT